MKEKIYTIPVTDALKEKSECPFCVMYDSLDKQYVDYMLGPSYMEDDIRMDTDKSGFCAHHFDKMYAGQNRLGLALMAYTHIVKLNKELASHSKGFSSGARTFFSKGDGMNNVSRYLNNLEASCYICNKLNDTFDRYLDTFFMLMAKTDEIKGYLKGGNGFCLKHFSLILSLGEKKLSSADYKDFSSLIISIQLEKMKILEDDLDWFIKKFDYRFSDEPWKNSKDALIRAMMKLASLEVE